MQKTISEIGDFISNRLTSPFLFSYVFASCIFNYRVVPVLFSQEHYKASFKYLDEVLYASSWVIVVKVFLAPLGFAIFYTFGWPIFEAHIAAGIERLAQRKRRILMKAEQKEPVDTEVQAQFFARYEETIENLRKRHMSAKGDFVAAKAQLEAKCLDARKLAFHHALRRLFPSDIQERCIWLMREIAAPIEGDAQTLERCANFQLIKDLIKFFKLRESDEAREDVKGVVALKRSAILNCFQKSEMTNGDVFAMLAGLDIIDSADPSGDNISIKQSEFEYLFGTLRRRMDPQDIRPNGESLPLP